jgi:hypothetical protein
MMREDRSEYEEAHEHFDIPEEDCETSIKTQIGKEDPPEFIPYGICTSPTRIDWDLRIIQ